MTHQSTPGMLVLVVGPSGAGKDTLIQYARERLRSDTRFRFVQRYITRDVTSADAESHCAVTRHEFARLVDSGALCLHWEAHGHLYGLPALVRDWISEGLIVVANGSRSSLSTVSTLFSRIEIIHVTADRAVLERRIASRGRESKAEQFRRIRRSDSVTFSTNRMVEIDNSATIEVGGELMLTALRALAGTESQPATPQATARPASRHSIAEEDKSVRGDSTRPEFNPAHRTDRCG